MLTLRRDAQPFLGPRQGNVEYAPFLLDIRF